MRIVNTVPPGLMVTCRPPAEPLAVTVTVAVAPALIVPPEGLRCTVPSPLDTVLDQVTGPPCAWSEIVVPSGGTSSPPPDGETASVPGVAGAVDVGVVAVVPVAVGLVVADGRVAGVVAWFAAVGVRCGAVVAEPVVFGVALAELAGEVPGEAPNDAAAVGPVGSAEPDRCPAASFPCPELSMSVKAIAPMTAAATKPAATTTRLLRRGESSPPVRAGAGFDSGTGLGKPRESKIPA
jgi:hypothetical protein